ncbi:MAG: hypothetical protein U1E38_09235 [Rhodospirillales bacterium]
MPMQVLKVMLAALLPLLLAACSSVVGENKQGIWFREPFIGGWDMQDEADRHCAKYGKTAVRAGDLEPTGYALPVVSFNCVPRSGPSAATPAR